MKIYYAGTIYIPVVAALFISMSPSSGYAKSSSSTDFSLPPPVTVAVIFLISFFFGFLTLYFCRCMVENLVRMWHNRHNPTPPVDVASVAGEIMNNGLDPELIQAFPTFIYSTVKEFRGEKHSLECAICLGEFDDIDMLRLLTICCHVFHKECIDIWLESHKTCPVCRRELDVPRKSFEKSPLFVRSNSMREIVTNQSFIEDSVCINIKDDPDDKIDRSEEEEEEESTSNSRQEQHSIRERMVKFSRSHSTGHSIGRTREDDRYTLRLPDHVKIELVRGHHAVKSCIVFGEFTSPLNDRNISSGEASETRGGDQLR